jgi:polar amino acid transport system substrate-binding protein
MKRLFLVAAAVVALTGAANAQNVRIATEGAYAPWNAIDDSGNLVGYDIDVGNEICVRAALTCEWIQTAWDTMIPNLNANNYDAIMAGMSITDERKVEIDFTQDYKPPTPSTYIMAASAAFDLEKPTGLRIGTQGATIQSAYAEANLKDGNTLVTFSTAEDAIADLGAGNIDVILAEVDYLNATASGAAGTFKVEGPLIPIGGGVGVGLRKGDDELEKKMNDALTAMKADGKLNELLQKWFPGEETRY